MQPAELLKDFSVVGIPIENPTVSCLCRVILRILCQKSRMTAFVKHIRLSAVREHGQFGTRYPPRSVAVGDLSR